jgi:hypothetical protein
MLRNTNGMGILLAGIFMILLSGCYKDKTVLFDTGAEITRTVSFSADLIPIFNNSCSGSGCHAPGAVSPDLSEISAYNSLLNGSYMNVQDPKQSLLYLWMTGKKGAPMPTSGTNKEYNALVLAWIKQGANNN